MKVHRWSAAPVLVHCTACAPWLVDPWYTPTTFALASLVMTALPPEYVEVGVGPVTGVGRVGRVAREIGRRLEVGELLPGVAVVVAGVDRHGLADHRAFAVLEAHHQPAARQLRRLRVEDAGTLVAARRVPRRVHRLLGWLVGGGTGGDGKGEPGHQPETRSARDGRACEFARTECSSHQRHLAGMDTRLRDDRQEGQDRSGTA